MEQYKTAGCILVSAYNSDLGDELERNSGYFSRPFDYKKMKENTPFIVQFHSESDHLVPVEVGREVARLLSPTEYIETKNDGHFQAKKYDMFTDAILKHGKFES
uniref:Peptidase S9 prolyl oligopeptidase catalytic domain-containing protein n=1 Tax=Paramoeba aestuarina TaxID=180227 RepID=A0A7S4P6J4_9EUKA|mmetsp:Transcript_37010/g.58221  ORF Transcript_37010/g.58221 Transcript_37010/m.58221 type:complete len:104 (+) Transcript_37010:186-497(+)